MDEEVEERSEMKGEVVILPRSYRLQVTPKCLQVCTTLQEFSQQKAEFA
jgi:hypothetical protein